MSSLKLWMNLLMHFRPNHEGLVLQIDNSYKLYHIIKNLRDGQRAIV